MKNLAIQTLGCKVNQYESEAISQLFQNAGYSIVSDLDIADVCVINTCSVTNMSDRKSRQLIRKCVNAKNKPLVVVTGCYSEAKPEEAAMIEGVSVVIGTNNKNEILSLVEKTLETGGKTIEIFPENKDSSFNFAPVSDYLEKTRAIIKIQDGCNSFCSYCIIPYVRGRCRSRNPDDILAEAVSLAKNGYKELVLAGIHVCRYGTDLDGITFTELLSQLENVKGIERIRLSSIEPSAFTDDFFEFYKKTKKLCPHFHISLQSGSNAVIERMNRHYTREAFIEIVRKLREIKVITTITTDVIVGFPGETEEEFNDTLDLISKVKFLKVHVFKYSKRAGTKAAEMENQINGTISEQRSKKAIKLSEETEAEVLREYIGKTLNILFEEEKNGYMYGISENYIPVFVEKGEVEQREVKPVLIEKVLDLSAYGKIKACKT